MSHQVPWSRKVIDVFAEEMLLSDEEIFLLESRAKGWTVSRQAMYLNCSESRIHQLIKILKQKYDIYAMMKINKLQEVYKPSQEMLDKWDESHRGYVEKVAWIKQMLSM